MTTAQRIAYLGGSFSVGVFGAFNNYTMSLWLTTFTTSYIVISLLGNSKSVEGAIVSPLFGFLSDRTWLGWLGRRRPFILAGGLLTGLLMAATPWVARLPIPADLPWVSGEIGRILPIILVVFLFTLTFNIGDDLHKALRADLTDGRELNLLSSLATVVDIASQVGLLVLGFLVWNDGVPDWAFLLVGAFIALGALLTTFGVQEPPPDAWREREIAPTHNGVSPIALIGVYRSAFVFIIVILAYWSGVNAVLPLVSIFVRDILGTTAGEAQLLPALLLLSTTLMAFPVGWLGTRFGKRKVLACGYLVMAVAAGMGLVISTKEQGAVLFFLAGIGNSAAVVLAIPIMADLVPRQHMGIATGLMAAAGSIAAPLASLVAGGLSDLYGPRAIFAVMAVMTLVAIALLPGVRPPVEYSSEAPVPSPSGEG